MGGKNPTRAKPWEIHRNPNHKNLRREDNHNTHPDCCRHMWLFNVVTSRACNRNLLLHMGSFKHILSKQKNTLP